MDLDPYKLSPELTSLYRSVDIPFYAMIRKGGFSKADLYEFIDAWKLVYNELIQAQDRDKKRYHKGGVLHNLGLTYLLLNEKETAFKYFVYAVGEDIASEAQGYSKDSLLAPGARTLIMNWGSTSQFFDKLKQTVIKLLKEDKYYNPKEDLSNFIKDEKQELEPELKNLNFIASAGKDLEVLPPKWEDRVFIGGSYSDSSIFPKLRYIEELVKKNGFVPIIVGDYKNITGMNDFVKSVRLLLSCRLAIFENTVPSGHYLELRAADEYKIPTLMLQEDLKGDKRTSSLLKHMGDDIKYTNFEDLKSKIEDFLKKNDT